MKVCFELRGGEFPITLFQESKDSYTVVYGVEVKDGLNYAQAATELGCAIMYSLMCGGKLDHG